MKGLRAVLPEESEPRKTRLFCCILLHLVRDGCADRRVDRVQPKESPSCFAADDDWRRLLRSTTVEYNFDFEQKRKTITKSNENNSNASYKL